MISWDIQSLELIQKKNCSAECVDRKTHLKSEVKEKWLELIGTPTLGTRLHFKMVKGLVLTI